jgi:hypothetical protein
MFHQLPLLLHLILRLLSRQLRLSIHSHLSHLWLPLHLQGQPHLWLQLHLVVLWHQLHLVVQEFRFHFLMGQ